MPLRHLRIVEYEAGAGINGRSASICGGVDLLTSVQLESLKFGLPKVGRYISDATIQ